MFSVNVFALFVDTYMMDGKSYVCSVSYWRIARWCHVPQNAPHSV